MTIRTSTLMWALLLAPVAGCDVSESVHPAPLPNEGGSSGTGTTAPVGGGGGGGGAPAQIIRTVETRHPYGNVAATDNLLWDGDFEWSSAFSDQYGWLFGPPYSYQVPAATIGAACRSGIKCMTVPKNKAIIGIGVGSETGPLAVTVFAKPADGQCAAIDVYLIDAQTLGKDVAIPEVSETADSVGWCLFRATVESYPERVFLLVDNNTGQDVVVDDAVVRSVPKGQEPSPAPPPKMEPPTAQEAAHRDVAREAIARLRGPYVPPPSPAKRAFEERALRKEQGR